MPVFSKKILLLLFLYFVQGLPYGFQTQFLPIHLRSLGHELTNVTLLRLLHAPWFCKSIWAPLVDHYSTKRRWLLASISGLCLLCLAGCFMPFNNLRLLCFFLFIMNLLVSTQDIAVDALAVSLLQKGELGSGNTAQVVGYKLGSIFGGGVLLSLMETGGWFSLFGMLAMLYLEAFMFVFISPSFEECKTVKVDVDLRQRVSEWQEKNIAFQEHEQTDRCSDTSSKENISSTSQHHTSKNLNDYNAPFVENKKASQFSIIVKTIKDLISVPGTQWMVVFVLIYKLGEQGALGMLPLYLVDKHVPNADIAMWTGIIGQTISIFGSLLGGCFITYHKIPVDFLLRQFCLLRLLPLGALLLVVFSSSVQILHGDILLYLGTGAMMLLLLLGGMVTTATFTFMMQCSRLAPPHLQATHYTMLATLEVFGKLIFMTLSGWLVDRLGFPCMYLVFSLLTLIIMFWFRWCPTDFLQEQELESESDYNIYEPQKEKCE